MILRALDDSRSVVRVASAGTPTPADATTGPTTRHRPPEQLESNTELMTTCWESGLSPESGNSVRENHYSPTNQLSGRLPQPGGSLVSSPATALDETSGDEFDDQAA